VLLALKEKRQNGTFAAYSGKELAEKTTGTSLTSAASVLFEAPASDPNPSRAGLLT
jgi:hypothetical protein